MSTHLIKSTQFLRGAVASATYMRCTAPHECIVLHIQTILKVLISIILCTDNTSAACMLPSIFVNIPLYSVHTTSNYIVYTSVNAVTYTSYMSAFIRTQEYNKQFTRLLTLTIPNRFNDRLNAITYTCDQPIQNMCTSRREIM